MCVGTENGHEKLNRAAKRFRKGQKERNGIEIRWVTYDGVIEGFEHLGVALDLLVARCDGRNVNRNVSVRLRQRIVDLVGELQDVVLDITLGSLGLKGRQVDLLDDGLEVAEPVL